MSKFINFNKRSVTLPPGCKNLIDILQPPVPSKLVSNIHPGTISPHERPIVTRGESFTGRVSDIGKYVAMVFESRATSFILMMTPPDEAFTIHVDRMEDRAIRASVVVQSATDQERAVRYFFAHRGLNLPEDSGMPPQLVPDLPVQVTCNISPIPSEAPLLSILVADLFRHTLGLSDDSQLCFRYYEARDAN